MDAMAALSDDERIERVNRRLRERSVKVVPQVDQKFIESHEVSLLSLLVVKYPERAAVFLSRLKASMEK